MANNEQFPRRNLNRRNIFKLGAGASFLLGSAGIGIREVNRIENGLENENGIFYPLYEIHGAPPSADKIPQRTNIFFVESTDRDESKDFIGKRVYSSSPKEVLENSHHQDKLDLLAQREIEYAVGDVFYDMAWMQGGFINTKIVEPIAGVYLLSKNLKKTNRSDHPDESVFNRREMMRKVGLGVGAWAFTPVIGSALRTASLLQPNYDIARAIIPMTNFPDYFHPENAVAHFRSAAMANKILELAKDYKERTGKKAYIAFNVGSGHSGMEDFIALGQDFCRFIMTSLYPNLLLKNSIKTSGGVDNFCTARLIQIPTRNRQISERRIVDTELKMQIEKM